jgi:glycosyltransferase involved in cell wall biosynthesis
MKKVLLVGYPFPLRRGGSPRLLGLAKYLPEFGWQPIILTAPLEEKPGPGFRIVETGYNDTTGFYARLLRLNPKEDIGKQVKNRLGMTAKKSVVDFFLTLAGEIVNYPDSEKGWKKFAVKTGEELLAQEGINAIISSSAPVTAHVIANQLKRGHKIPWVADLRDLWTQNHNYSYGPLRKLIDRRLELKTLSVADALVTVSRPLAQRLHNLHQGKKVHVITNGFDPETASNLPTNPTDKFTITYTGTIYSRRQDASRLLITLRDLISEGVIDPGMTEVRFYGLEEPGLNKMIEQYKLANVVSQRGTVSRQEALAKQNESQLLLFLDWDDPREKGVFSSKIFEYLSARRPILATGGSDDDVVAGLLRETQAGIHATTVQDIKNALKDFYLEYKATGKVTYQGEDSKINKYNQREMAREFSEVLLQVS